MPLNLSQMYQGTIVDRISEWGEDRKERPLNPIMRGIIVKVDGDPAQEAVAGIYVCFGPEERKEVKALTLKAVDVKVNDITVKAFKVQARELNMVHDYESRAAKEAWIRLFRIPTNVGIVFENRNAKGSRHRKTLDALQLTPSPKEGPVTDEASLQSMDLPEREA